MGFADKRRIINVFIKYARLGLSSGKVDVFTVYDRIRGCCRSKAEARELLAVYDTVRFLNLTGNTESLRALSAVYFSLDRRPRKSDISRRITRYACDYNCDERTVYRRLALAIKIYENILDSYY